MEDPCTDGCTEWKTWTILNGKESDFFADLWVEDVENTEAEISLDFTTDLAEENGTEDSLSNALGMFGAWNCTISIEQEIKIRAHRYLPREEKQTGTDIREYNGLSTPIMGFRAYKEGTTIY